MSLLKSPDGVITACSWYLRVYPRISGALVAPALNASEPLLNCMEGPSTLPCSSTGIIEPNWL